MMRTDQKGLTLVELLVALAISGMLLTGLVAAIYQVIKHTDSNNSTITAVNQIETAARWIASDIQMAQANDLPIDGTPVSLNPDGTNQVTLTWTDWTDWVSVDKGWNDDFQSYSSTYYLSGTDLLRDYNDGTLTTTTVARYIDSIEFTLNGGVIEVNITSAPKGDAWPSEQRTYYVDLRPVGEDPRR